MLSRCRLALFNIHQLLFMIYGDNVDDIDLCACVSVFVCILRFVQSNAILPDYYTVSLLPAIVTRLLHSFYYFTGSTQDAFTQ